MKTWLLFVVLTGCGGTSIERTVEVVHDDAGVIPPSLDVDPTPDAAVPMRYQVQTQGPLKQKGIINVNASCKSEKDTLVTGGCWITGSTEGVSITINIPMNAASPGLIPYWGCVATNSSVVNSTLNAVVVCETN